MLSATTESLNTEILNTATAQSLNAGAICQRCSVNTAILNAATTQSVNAEHLNAATIRHHSERERWCY